MREHGFTDTDSVNYGAGNFVTYRRKRDGVAVHVAPDGLFAMFDAAQTLIGEGSSSRDLRSLLGEDKHRVASVIKTRRGQGLAIAAAD